MEESKNSPVALRIEQMRLATELMKDVVIGRDNWPEKYLEEWTKIFKRIKQETDL